MIQRCDEDPEYCPVEECLKFLAGAWTPQILWQLRVGPKRFGELRRALPGISAKVLTTRLRELEERDMIARAVKPSSPPAVEYKLIELGFEIQPVLDAIAEVGHKLHARLSDKRSRAEQQKA
jgi:DNA-binding HxlR family transcriptional regulator